MPGTPVLIELDGMSFGPDATGLQTTPADGAGRRTFVGGGAPGERVEASLVEVSKKSARAELVRVVEASPGRVEAPCPLFGRCGGCQWQHLAYDVQLAEKRRILAHALGRTPDAVRMIGAPRPYGWRARARLHLEEGVLGFRPLRGTGVVDVEACPVLEPEAARALEGVREALAAARDPALRRLRAEVSIAGADVGLSLAGPAGRARGAGDQGGAQRALVERLAQAMVASGKVASVALAGGRPTDAPRLLAGQGDPTMALRFGQANPSGNALLIEEVLAAAGGPALRGGVRVLELYAGAGNLTRALVAAGAKVTAVESDPLALPALATTGAQVEPGEAAAVTARHAAFARAGRRGAAVVVMDPPRTGAGPLVQAILGLAVPRIVYVSCDPMTLARDVRALEQGYTVAGVVGLDLFPQSFHIEAVVTMVAGTLR